MKKLAALASMALLLCASASFAKKAMDEEEMELVTAAGQPSVISTKVDAGQDSGIGKLTSTVSSDTGVTSTLSPGTTALPNTATVESVEATAWEGNLALELGDLEVNLGPVTALPTYAPNNTNTATPQGYTVVNGPSFSVGNGAAGLNIDYSESEIESFSLSVASGTGTLTATSSASASSTIGQAEAYVTAKNEDASLTTLLVASSSQTNLRAVALNNVAGENQLATAVNVQSGVLTVGTASLSPLQSNSITQSWGSTYDWSYAPGMVTATAAAAAGGAGGKVISKDNMIPCVLSEAGCGKSEANGGNASSSSASEKIDNLALTITADKINFTEVESAGDAHVDVSELDKSIATLVVQSFSQTNLAAIAVNNVVGRNQVATAMNANTNGSLLIGNQAANPQVAFVGSASTAKLNGSQSNTINQYRGTPCTSCSQ